MNSELGTIHFLPSPHKFIPNVWKMQREHLSLVFREDRVLPMATTRPLEIYCCRFPKQPWNRLCRDSSGGKGTGSSRSIDPKLPPVSDFSWEAEGVWSAYSPGKELRLLCLLWVPGARQKAEKAFLGKGREATAALIIGEWQELRLRETSFPALSLAPCW